MRCVTPIRCKATETEGLVFIKLAFIPSVFIESIFYLDNVLYYITKAKRLTSNEENIKIILVGNKCDLIEQREVSYETAREFADSYNITYYEVSCKSSEPVEYAFVSLASMILKSRMQKQTELISPQQNNTSRVSRKMFSKCSIM